MTTVSDGFRSVLNIPVISRIRRNHGLEHATLHVLSKKFPRTSMAGHSDAGGFWLLGDVPTHEIELAVQEALGRMKAGEENLAVHPNCGTNFVTSGILAGSAAFVGMLGAGGRFRDKLERLPLIATLATLALMVAQPVGMLVQEQVTTSGHPETLEVVEVIPNLSGKVPSHRVITRY